MEKLGTMMKKECLFDNRKRSHLFESLLYKNGKAQIEPEVASRLVYFRLNGQSKDTSTNERKMLYVQSLYGSGGKLQFYGIVNVTASSDPVNIIGL